MGIAGVGLASRRFHAFRQLTLPFRVFLASSSATFVAIIAADRASRSYELSRHADERRYINEQESLQEQLDRAKPTTERMKEWATANRYSIVFGAWVVSMGGAWYLVNRNPFLTGAQKLVQARVYAQGLTLATLVASFSLEARDATLGKGRWETVKILDPNDPTHKHIIEKRIHHERYAGEDQWMDMVSTIQSPVFSTRTWLMKTNQVAAEEAKLKERHERQKKLQAKQEKTSAASDKDSAKAA